MSEVPQSLPHLHRFLNAVSGTMLVAVLAILVIAAVLGSWWLIFWSIGHLVGAW
jgi:hypothetical protein